MWWCCSNEGYVAFFSVFEKKTKMTTISITFFSGFATKKGNNNYRSLFQWFCYEKGDDNKSSPFSMVVVLL
jgi:hypothetical protein